MQVHCLLRRIGPTTVTLENTKYTFMPIPGTNYHTEKRYDFKKDAQGNYTREKVFRDVSVPEESTSVCDIPNQEHADHLLRLSMFEEYDQNKIDLEREEAKKRPADPMVGFGVEKYLDKGYLAVDKRKKPVLYAGESLTWVPNKADVVPFKSEIEAYSFAKEEAENPSDETEREIEQMAGKNKKKG